MQQINKIKEEFREKAKQHEKECGLKKMNPDLGATAGWRLGFFEGIEYAMPFIEKALKQ